MGFTEAVRKLNEIKSIGLIKEYAIGGAYAVNLYDVPHATYDLDVFVIVASESDLITLNGIYDYFTKAGARKENEYIFIEDLPIQFLANLGPLHNNAVENAITMEFEGVPARFVDIEYLILLLLTSYRAQDKLRIGRILKKADTAKILQLLERFSDAKNPLSERYREVLGRAQ